MTLEPMTEQEKQAVRAMTGRRSEVREFLENDSWEILARNDQIFKGALKGAREAVEVGAEDFEKNFLVFYAGGMAYGNVHANSDVDYLLLALPDNTGKISEVRKRRAKALTEKIDSLFAIYRPKRLTGEGKAAAGGCSINQNEVV